MARFFRVSHNRAGLFEPTTAIFPKHVAPVVRCADDGEREIVTMSWGFMLRQNGTSNRPARLMRTTARHRFEERPVVGSIPDGWLTS